MLSFDDSCFEAAKRFVQTAVIIDDEAEFNVPEKKKSPPPDPILDPLAGLTHTTESDPTEAEGTYITDDSDTDQRLDVGLVVNGFADLKIACSVQRPDFGTDKQQDIRLKEWALNCASHADITIIDWRLFRKDLHIAADIILDLIKMDIEAGGRLRLICVYTMQSHPRNILDDIKKEIKVLGLSIAGDKSELSCTVDDKIRIVVFNKEDSQVSDKNARVVPFDELPKAALMEYSFLAKGLVSNAALHSIAAVREQTHGLLALMNKSLDGAFCAHRALIPDPDDSIDYLLNLISKEIATKILNDEKARNSLDAKSLKAWLKELKLPDNLFALEMETLWEYLKNDRTHVFDVQKQRAKAWLKKKEDGQIQVKDTTGKDITYSEAGEFIEKGLFQEIKNCFPPSENNPGTSSELFYLKKDDSELACNEFSRLSSTSNDGGALRGGTVIGSFLTLGSVLKVRSADSDYWLCLQPQCDSVRLSEKTEMLFLQLFKGDARKADFIVKLQSGTYLAFAIKPPSGKPRLTTWRLSPNKDSRRILIKRLDMNPKFKWVADLRPEKAQAIAQQVLSNASRIGLDEFEILRRKGSHL